MKKYLIGIIGAVVVVFIAYNCMDYPTKLKLMVNLGSADSEEALFSYYSNSYDEANMLYWGKRLVARGELYYADRLAEMYAEHKQNYPEAFKWQKIAARDEDPSSLTRLACYYEYGRATPVDKVKARRLFVRAASLWDYAGLYKMREYAQDVGNTEAAEKWVYFINQNNSPGMNLHKSGRKCYTTTEELKLHEELQHFIRKQEAEHENLSKSK